MADSDFESAARQTIFDLITLNDVPITPGQLLAHIRTANNIPADKFAAALQLSTHELQDIECDRVPFPTILHTMIFIYGVPTWYNTINS